MKQLLLLSSALICAVSCGATVSKKQEVATAKKDTTATTRIENSIVGGYGESVKLTSDDLEIFTSAMKDYDTGGKRYIAKRVSRQVVAGTNYKFICEIEGEEGLSEVTIFQSLPHTNKKAKVTGIKRV